MAYQKKKVSVFDLIEQGTAQTEVDEHQAQTEIAYLAEFQEEAMEYIKNGDKYMGISTGYKGVDNLLGSFLPGELLTIGGDTGHGKSLFAMNIAQNVYSQYHKPVLVVNLELTTNQAVARFYNLADNHDYAGILVQRAPAVKYQDIDLLMKRAKDEGACLVVIDHLHFFNDAIGDKAHSMLTIIMKHFKECAVLNELPVILLSHVTPTTKPDGSLIKPNLHNFKGSRSIEQISDMVGFVFREKGQPEIEFYTRKNRSRPLNEMSTYLTQEGWKLKEQPAWIPPESEQSASSSPQKETLNLK